MLFVDDDLWINTFKRQDQKNIYQSLNVSDCTSDEAINKRFKDKQTLEAKQKFEEKQKLKENKESQMMYTLRSKFALKIFKPDFFNIPVEVK